MGSIGQYAGVKDYIYNAHIENVTMLNAQVNLLQVERMCESYERRLIDEQNGARLKAWAGPNVGYGYISNITYKNFYNFNVDWPIVLDACYFNVNSVCLSLSHPTPHIPNSSLFRLLKLTTPLSQHVPPTPPAST